MHRFRWLPGKVSTRCAKKRVEVANTISEGCLVSQNLRELRSRDREKHYDRRDEDTQEQGKLKDDDPGSHEVGGDR